MKKLLFIFAFATQFLFAQNAPCACPVEITVTAEKELPKEVFTFSTGQKILLCGYKNEDTGKPTYSEFILQECGQDTVVDFWGAQFTGVVTFYKDVITIKELKNLPTGKNRSFNDDAHWSTETLQYTNGKLVRKYSINRIIRKYNKEEIAQTLKEYEDGSANYKDDVEVLMNRLFVASISGSEKARSYFNNFGTFTLLDGAVLEEYKDLAAMLAQWEEK